MFQKTFACAIGLSAALLVSAAASAQSVPVLTVRPGQSLHAVSPTLYGLMTEEINYSYDGGLYAEMVRNRAFHSDWSGTPYWYLLERGDAAAKIEEDKTTGPSEALPASMRLTVDKADAKNPAGLVNVGFWGFALRANTTYTGSFYAKASSSQTVTVALVNDTTGKTVASAAVSGVGSEWAQHTFTLKTGALEASSSNHLALTVSQPGSVWFQLVSLFPPTYKNRPNGFRPDLMEKLAAMKPTFLRFPGGNYLEGNRVSERFEWKKTIGPWADRPTHPSPWGYHSSDGMGLLEFLEWCEDLKIEPVLAVYAGYSLQGERVPTAELGPYIQDALDEIEYVTGAADTKWGAMRAKNGHPAPFKLRYVEIGNEDWLDKSGSYAERYPPFYKALKAKYPELEYISTAPLEGVKPDVLDEHFYVRATQNFKDATHYDKTDRKGPKIFVGEWATREGLPTPDFGAALGDAAWMTGLERNSDIVIMAAYAPLLVRVDPGGMQWETDLIGYNGLASYGSPAYYAQVLFAQYLGDQVPESSLTGASPKLFYSATTAKGKLYLKLVNASSDPQALEIHLDGVKTAATAKVESLTATNPRETNSIDAPNRIVPVASTLSVKPEFRHTLPPFTIQAIAIDLQ